MKKTPLFILIFSLIFIISCNKNSYKSGKNISQATGWKINSSDGGFKLNSKYKGQINAPGMIFIQGGTFVKGNTKDNVMHDWNNTPTQQYVRSFFLDETEVTNAMYVEYLFWPALALFLSHLFSLIWNFFLRKEFMTSKIKPLVSLLILLTIGVKFFEPCTKTDIRSKSFSINSRSCSSSFT